MITTTVNNIDGEIRITIDGINPCMFETQMIDLTKDTEFVTDSMGCRWSIGLFKKNYLPSAADPSFTKIFQMWYIDGADEAMQGKRKHLRMAVTMKAKLSK